MAEYIIGSVRQGTGVKNVFWKTGDEISATECHIMSFASSGKDELAETLDWAARVRLKSTGGFTVRVEQLIELEDGARYAELNCVDEDSRLRYQKILSILGVSDVREEMIATIPPPSAYAEGMLFNVGYASIFLSNGGGDHTLLHDYQLDKDQRWRFEKFED